MTAKFQQVLESQGDVDICSTQTQLFNLMITQAIWIIYCKHVVTLYMLYIYYI